MVENYVDSSLNRIKTYLNLGNIEQAFRLSNELTNAYPEDKNVLLTAGQVYFEKLDFNNSATCFEKANSLEPLHGRQLQAQKNATFFCRVFSDPLNNRLKENELKTLQGSKKYNLIMAYIGKLQAVVTLEAFEKNALASVYISLKKYAHAIELLSELVYKNPSRIEYLTNLATSYFYSKNFGTAAALYTRILTLDQSIINVHFNLANCLQEEKNFDRAIVHYKRFLKNGQEYSVAHNNLGLCYKIVGKFDEAKFHFLRATEIDEFYVDPFYNLVQIDKHIDVDLALKKLLPLEEKHKKDISAQVKLNFIKGTLYEANREFKKSFHFYTKGNELKSERHKSYTLETDQILFEKIKKIKIKKIIHNSYDGFDASAPRPIFIVGMMRSGTTLVEQMLSNHSLVRPLGEVEYLTESINLSEIFKIDKADLAYTKIRENYLKMVKNNNFEQPIFTDKMPANFRWIGIIKSSFPNAKIIICKRNKNAVCWSIFKQNFVSSGNRWANNLENIYRYYDLYDELISYWMKLYGDDLCVLEYEKLVQHTQVSLVQLLTYCELSFEPECLDFKNSINPVLTASSTQVREGIYKTANSRWKNFEPIIKECFPNLLRGDG